MDTKPTLIFRASRTLGFLATGRWIMLCAAADLYCWRRYIRIADPVLRFYDGRDHCARMSFYETRGWGVSDGLDRTGL